MHLEQISILHIDPYTHSLPISQGKKKEPCGSNILSIHLQFAEECVQLFADLFVAETTRHSHNIVVATIMLRHRGVL